MTMDSAPARHTGQGGTGPTGAGALAPAHPAAARRSATAIHPPRRPRAAQARSAVRPRRVRRRGRVLPLLTADALAAVLTATTLPATAPAVLYAAPLLLTALHAQAGLYRPRLAPSALLELPVLAARSAVLWCSVAAVTAAAAPARAMGWSALLTAVCLQAVLACAGRGLVNQLHRRSAVRRPSSALVVGPGAGASAVAAALHGRPEFGLRPVGLADTQAPAEGDGGALPLLATHEDIRRAVIQNSVGHAVFTRPRRPTSAPPPWSASSTTTAAGCGSPTRPAPPRSPACGWRTPPTSCGGTPYSRCCRVRRGPWSAGPSGASTPCSP